MRHDDDLTTALTPVVREFARLGVRYLVGGCVASAAHGEFRATNDVDLLAELEPAHVAAFVAALGDRYYVSEPAVREPVEGRATFNLIHLDTMLKLDVFVSRGTPHDASAQSRATPRSLSGDATASRVHLASPEDLVLAKLCWYRKGGEVSSRQWGDIVGVLRVQGGGIDSAYLRAWAAQLQVADLLERALVAVDDLRDGGSEPA